MLKKVLTGIGAAAIALTSIALSAPKAEAYSYNYTEYEVCNETDTTIAYQVDGGYTQYVYAWDCNYHYSYYDLEIDYDYSKEYGWQNDTAWLDPGEGVYFYPYDVTYFGELIIAHDYYWYY